MTEEESRLEAEGAKRKVKKKNDQANVCPVCGKGFYWSGSLSRHMRTHTGEKPYECQFCLRRFTQSGTLHRHVRTHTGEKPYECRYQGCDRRFSTNSNRSQHEKKHLRNGERTKSCLVTDKVKSNPAPVASTRFEKGSSTVLATVQAPGGPGILPTLGPSRSQHVPGLHPNALPATLPEFPPNPMHNLEIMEPLIPVNAVSGGVELGPDLHDNSAHVPSAKGIQLHLGNVVPGSTPGHINVSKSSNSLTSMPFASYDPLLTSWSFDGLHSAPNSPLGDDAGKLLECMWCNVKCQTRDELMTHFVSHFDGDGGLNDYVGH